MEDGLPRTHPSVSKPITVVEGLRDQRLRSDAAKLQTSVSGPTNFLLGLFSLSSFASPCFICLFVLTSHYPLFS